jgi:superoxide dismutase, Cu-Zn family
MTQRFPFAPIAAILALSLAGWNCSRHLPADLGAHAKLFDARGGEVGRAQLTETESGVKIDMTVVDLPAGDYIVQIHEAGACKPPGFLSAGKPYPPPEELAMVESVAPALHRSIAQFEVSGGRAEVEAVAPVVTLRGGHNSLFHPGGTALIIDDLSPAGTYEGRVACGLITRADQPSAESLPPGDLESARQAKTGTPGKEYQQPKQKPFR